MSYLTTFQDQLLSDLQKEFKKLNSTTPAKGKFTIDSVKKDIEETEAFRKSILEHNKAIAQQLRIEYNYQLNEFNREFSPVSLALHWRRSSSGVSKMFEDEHTMKNPHSVDLALYFEGEEDVNLHRLHVLYDYEPVEIKTSCDLIRGFKIKGLLWSTRGWVHRHDAGGYFYKTLDNFIQGTENFQRTITLQYKHLTSK
jgi:hypothetical protein